MPAAKPPKRQRVSVENINVFGSVSQVDAVKYQATRRALLEVLPAGRPGLTQTEMMQRVPAHLPQDEFPGGAKSGWWIKCVQLDLEAKRIIERDRSAKPLRWSRTELG
jgi:uncharacterized protein DUF6958